MVCSGPSGPFRFFGPLSALNRAAPKANST
jgi:hypothetical protein